MFLYCKGKNDEVLQTLVSILVVLIMYVFKFSIENMWMFFLDDAEIIQINTY